jgi:hypothetical protein
MWLRLKPAPNWPILPATDVAAGEFMTDWVLNRWKRFGHDRLYAATPGGTALGYLDMKTNELHPDQPDDLPLLTAAVACYFNPHEAAPGRHVHSPATVETAREPAAFYVPRHEVVDWNDVGSTVPGSAARERAVAERSAAPVRTMLARLFGVHTAERAWRIGADGEEAVAAELVKLGPAWRVVHAVPVGDRGADIDHVVIGPGGVFTVNAKNHPHAAVWVGGDTLLVNGTRTFYVRNSRHEAARAARLLEAATGHPVRVRAVIAIAGAGRGLTVKQQPLDGAVQVLARRELVSHLANLPPELSPAEVAALHGFACRSTTWQPAWQPTGQPAWQPAWGNRRRTGSAAQQAPPAGGKSRSVDGRR